MGESRYYSGTAAPVQVDPKHPSAELSRRLEVREQIGRGGIAAIRVGWDLNLAREMALKVLLQRHRGDASATGRLIEEAQIMAQLDHPGIVPVHELAEDADGNVFFTMKLVRGRTLHDLLAGVDYRERSEAELFDQLQIFLKVCDAVSFAHSRGVIHRDLKPDNVMVGEYGEVYVMDWGIARLADARPSTQDVTMPDTTSARYAVADEDGQVIGTPGFMAPEQARGDLADIDERADVFSLGAILYYLLTQAPPYFGRNSREMLANTLTREVVPPQQRVRLDLHPELCRIAMKALRGEMGQRYRSVALLKRDVERFLLSGWQLERRQYRAGQLIVREGEPGDEAFIIVSGCCAAFKVVDGVELPLREMFEGDVFGETAVLTEGQRTASVKALEPVTVLVVTREQFEQELGLGYFVGRFMKTLAERFRERDEYATRAKHESERFRLATSILKFLNFAGENVEDDRREARWSSLAEVLSSYLGRTPAELVDLVGELGFFRIDAERDVISLMRAG